MSDHDDSNSGATQSSDGKPRTPPPIPAPRRAKTAHPSTVISRIPKRASKPQSLSQPQTPDPPVRPAEPLDWGSGGEWRRMSSEKIHRDSSKMNLDNEEAPLVGAVSLEEPFDPDSPLQEKSQTGQLAHSTSLLDDGHAASDLEQSASSETLSEDDEVSAILAQITSSPQKSDCSTAAVVDTTTSLSNNDSDTSDPDSKLLGSPFKGDTSGSESATCHPFPSIPPREDESPTSDVKEMHDMREANENEEWSAIIAQTCGNVTLTKIDRLLARLGHKTKGLDNDNNDSSESEQSVVHTVAAPRDPLPHDAEDLHTVNTATGTSSQTILRGLIRDAHREMMYFTLPHAQFDKADLRDGLDYAFTMLQNATTKLAILTTLNDDMADISAEELNIWLVHVGCLDPQTCYEPRMPVVFESLSVGEIKIALAELIQSRLIVEDEVKQMKTLLKKRVEANAGSSSHVTDDDEMLWDGVFTTFMVIAIGGLYWCVR